MNTPNVGEGADATRDSGERKVWFVDGEPRPDLTWADVKQLWKQGHDFAGPSSGTPPKPPPSPKKRRPTRDELDVKISHFAARHNLHVEETTLDPEERTLARKHRIRCAWTSSVRCKRLPYRYAHIMELKRLRRPDIVTRAARRSLSARQSMRRALRQRACRPPTPIVSKTTGIDPPADVPGPIADVLIEVCEEMGIRLPEVARA